ncbi:hypothetical protein PG988_015949 [Apiospora saccharicola]
MSHDRFAAISYFAGEPDLRNKVAQAKVDRHGPGRSGTQKCHHWGLINIYRGLNPKELQNASIGFSLRHYSLVFLSLLAYNLGEVDAGLLPRNNGILPSSSPSNSFERRAGSIAARQDEEPDPGWLVENFIYLNVGNRAGQFYQSFALQQVGSSTSAFCIANADSPKPPAWTVCRDGIRFQFDRDTYQLSLNQTWGYSSGEGGTETIFTSVGSTKLCPGPGKSATAIDSSSIDGKSLRAPQGGYCPSSSLGRTEEKDGDVNADAGIECCVNKIKIEGTIVSKVPGRSFN